MREIKFRAWDKEAQKMLGHTDMLVSNQGTLLGDFWINDAPDYELMQFTGLHDKNGTPIFEGDIVLYSRGHNKIYMPCEVKWSKSRLCWHYKPAFEPGFALVQSVGKSSKVIGNIYENPDLLAQAA